jgi:heptosyltransferase II
MEKIIIYMPNWLGDAVMAIPCLRQIRKDLPNAKITVLTKEVFAGLYNNENVDEILFLKNKIKMIKEIRKRTFDIGILFPNSFESALIFFLGNIKKRIGFANECRSFLLTKVVKFKKTNKISHQADSFSYLLEKGLNCVCDKKDYKLRVSGKNLEINKHKKIIGIGVGASYGLAKEWPLEKYKKLVEELINKHNVLIVLFGTAKEKQAGHFITKDLNKEDYINLIAKTKVSELVLRINQCNVFIGNDSGLAHIAGALDVPDIVIFGSTSWEKSKPVGKNVRVISTNIECAPCFKRTCPKHTMQCMRDILVEDVLKSVEEYIL